MAKRYSEAFIEQALIKVYLRGERTIQSVAEELNVNCPTVKNWMKRIKSEHGRLVGDQRTSAAGLDDRTAVGGVA